MSERTETAVGAFLLLSGLGLLALLGLSLAGQGWLTRSNEYTVLYADGVGLVPGLDVTLSGLSVGHVTAVTLTPERQVSVQLSVDQDYAHFVRQDSVATARMTLDGKQLEIGPGTGAVLEPGGELRAGANVDPFIVLDAAETLAQLADALGELRGLSESLGLGEGELPTALDDAAFLLSQLRAGEGGVGRLFQEPELIDEVSEAMREVQLASSKLGETSEGLMQASAAITAASVELQSGSAAVKDGAVAIEAGMPAIQSGAVSIDEAMVEIDLTLAELNRSLTRMQSFLEQLPGVRKGKGKDEEKDPAPE